MNNYPIRCNECEYNILNKAYKIIDKFCREENPGCYTCPIKKECDEKFGDILPPEVLRMFIKNLQVTKMEEEE